MVAPGSVFRDDQRDRVARLATSGMPLPGVARGLQSAVGVTKHL